MGKRDCGNIFFGSLIVFAMACHSNLGFAKTLEIAPWQNHARVRFDRIPQSSSANPELVTVVSLSEAERLFTEVRALDLAYLNAADGCYARAHEISYRLDLLGARAFKIIANAGRADDPVVRGGEGDQRLSVPDRLHPGKNHRWLYHTAAAVLVKSGEKTEAFVLDPSVADRAVSAEEWLRLMTQHDPKMATNLEFKDAHWYQNPRGVTKTPKPTLDPRGWRTEDLLDARREIERLRKEELRQRKITNSTRRFN